MAILNRDYAKLNPDTSFIIPQFQSIASETHIEFRLATIDPNGNCTNGIERIASKKTYNGADHSKLNPWPRAKYLNVWVVNSIGSAGVAGYAYYPSSVVGLGLAVDGILILHDYIGSIGTGSVGTSRALTHEIGHYLNLPHCWGNTNDPGVACGDDGIPDTPRTKGWNHCPSGPNQAKICDTSIVENYQNYMEYSYCSRMFTEGQVTSMHATLNSSVSDRDHLWRQDNLVATGTATVGTTVCAPFADFHANRRMICQGGTITFDDDSWNGAVTTRQWDFTGGTPSTSSAANPTITYNTPGTYEVKLTVGNSAGSNVATKTSYVVVTAPNGIFSGPYLESFESPTILSQGWTIFNYEEDIIRWRECNYSGATGSSCVMIDNYYNQPGGVDEMITPPMDLRYMTGMNMSFKVAFASKVMDTTLLREKLRVMVSTNCGQNWLPLRTYSAGQLNSAGVIPSSFNPGSNQNLWRTLNFNVGNSYAQDKVMFKFEFTGGTYGNNFFFDDLNISGIVGIEGQEAAMTTMEVFPNPAQEQASVSLLVTEHERISITLIDLNGRQVLNIADGVMLPGRHTIPFSTEGIATGMYLVTVTDGTTKQVNKLAIQH
jgi:PKD repeat protein